MTSNEEWNNCLGSNWSCLQGFFYLLRIPFAWIQAPIFFTKKFQPIKTFFLVLGKAISIERVVQETEAKYVIYAR